MTNITLTPNPIEYPNLCWALQDNNKLRLFSDNLEHPEEEMAIIEKMINELRIRGCDGIQNKFEDLNETKIYSTVAELEIALELLIRKHQVTLLKDDHFTGKSPDILVETERGSVYFEVGYISSSDPASFLIEQLRSITAKFPYIVNFTFKPEISSPHLTHDVRKPQMKKLNDAAIQFESELKELEPGSFLITGNTDAFSYEIIGTVQEGHGYPAVLVSSCSTSLDHSHSHLTYHFTKKAQKRNNFPLSEQGIPYVLAFICDDPGVNCYEVQSLLYGDVCEIGMLQDTPFYRSIREKRWQGTLSKIQEDTSWSAILDAQASGWEDVLSRTYLLPHDYCYVQNYGLFFTSPIMKNVSGVLFCSASRRCEFYPNPFSDKEINNPSLCDVLGFSFKSDP